MSPIKVRVTKIMDFGTVVSIIGVDTESQRSVVIHVDHRPFQAIWNAWRKEGFPQPVAFDAHKLTLNLAIDPDLPTDEMPENDNALAG